MVSGQFSGAGQGASNAFSDIEFLVERLTQQFQKHLVTNVSVGQLGFSVSAVHDQVQMVDVGQSWVRRVAPGLRVKMKAKSEVWLQDAVDPPRSLVNLSHSIEKTFRLPSD